MTCVDYSVHPAAPRHPASAGTRPRQAKSVSTPQRRLPFDVSVAAHIKNTENGPGRYTVIGKGY